MNTYKPTYLYIKKHNVTGLKYFGKTVRDSLKYKGSGQYWLTHLKQHGNDVTTEWCKLFHNEKELVEYAINFSNTHNIVESKDWANLIVENGINSGGITGIKRSEETKQKIREKLKGKTFEYMRKPKSELWYKRHIKENPTTRDKY